jgi:hypothetical protein
MGDENFMESLSESIYEQIVNANFKDLAPLEEEQVYAIACDRATEQFESGRYE